MDLARAASEASNFRPCWDLRVSGLGLVRTDHVGLMNLMEEI